MKTVNLIFKCFGQDEVTTFLTPKRVYKNSHTEMCSHKKKKKMTSRQHQYSAHCLQTSAKMLGFGFFTKQMPCCVFTSWQKNTVAVSWSQRMKWTCGSAWTCITSKRLHANFTAFGGEITHQSRFLGFSSKKYFWSAKCLSCAGLATLN